MYVHGAKGTHFFTCATKGYPNILYNSRIFILLYIVSQKKVMNPGNKKYGDP